MKKLGLICLVLLLAMGILGVSYARWSQPLHISATVSIAAAPGVTTNVASSVTATSATLNGSLNSLGPGNSGVTVSFEYGDAAHYPIYNLGTVAGNPSSWNGAVPKAFTAALSNLQSGTKYHFRAKGVGFFTVYGQDQTFTTPQAQCQQAVTNDDGTHDNSLDPSSAGTWNWTGGTLTSSNWSGTRSHSNDAQTTVTGAGTQQLTVTLTNPYEGYYSSVGCTIKNTGSVNLKVTVNCSYTPYSDDLKITLGGIFASQATVTPGQEVFGSITFHQDCIQNYVVTITYTVTAVP